MDLLSIDLKQGYLFKLIADLLKHNTTNYNIHFNKDMAYIKTMDRKKTKFFKIKIFGKNLAQYNCKENILVGVSSSSLHQMVRSLTRKDSLKMYIKEKDSNTMTFKLSHSKKENSSTVNSIRIIKIPDVEVDMKFNYLPEREISTEGKDLVKKLKDISVSKNKTVNISTIGTNMRFLCNREGIFSSNCLFGNEEVFDGDDLKYDHNENYSFQDMNQLIKLMLNSHQVSFNFAENSPMRVTIFIGPIGELTVYIKSIEMQEKEENEEKKNDF